MKKRWPIFIAVVLGSQFCGNAPASDMWQICIELPVVSISTKQALELVPALRASPEPAVASLQAMIASGEATLIGWPVMWTRDSGRSVIETIEEVRYPTAFNPPQEGSRVGFLALDHDLPNSFDTRNTGLTVDASPHVSSDGAWIDVTIDPTHSFALGFQRFKFWDKSPNHWAYIYNGRFSEVRPGRLQFLVRSGQWKLAASTVVQKPTAHVELFLVRATAHSLAP